MEDKQVPGVYSRYRYPKKPYSIYLILIQYYVYPRKDYVPIGGKKTNLKNKKLALGFTMFGPKKQMLKVFVHRFFTAVSLPMPVIFDGSCPPIIFFGFPDVFLTSALLFMCFFLTTFL